MQLRKYDREKYWKDKPRKRRTNKQQNTIDKHKYHNKRNELLKLIGDKCVICNTTKHLVFHEIHGKPHLTNGTEAFKYYIENYKDFITLCTFHHRFLHQFAKCHNWELFKTLIEKLINF